MKARPLRPIEIELLRQSVNRFWSGVSVGDPEDCWNWRRSVAGGGYGQYTCGGKRYKAHRVAWVLTTDSDVPGGLELDHICSNRRCVNPQHLEPVTGQVNKLRGDTVNARNAAKSRCIRGHEFVPGDNFPSAIRVGKRNCRACVALRRDYVRRAASKLGLSRNKYLSQFGGSIAAAQAVLVDDSGLPVTVTRGA